MVDSEEVVFLLLLGLRLLNVSLDLVARIFEPRWDVSRCQLLFLTNRVLLLLCYEMLQLGFLVDFFLCFEFSGLVIWYLLFFLKYMILTCVLSILLSCIILLLLLLLYLLLPLLLLLFPLLLLDYVLGSPASKLRHESLVVVHVEQAVEALCFTVTEHGLVHSLLLCLLLGLVELLLLSFVSAPLPRLLGTHLLPQEFL